MDQEIPSTSEKAVRFRAREEVSLIETVEYGGPEYATATQRRRRRRRHVMRNSARSSRFAFAFCLLAIVSILFVYWLAKYYVLVKETTSTQDTTTDRISKLITTTKVSSVTTKLTTTKLTTTTMDPRCKANGGRYAGDGWCYTRAYNCDPPFTLSTLFERGTKAASSLKEYVKSQERDWRDIIFFVAARAHCTDGFVEYYNNTKIDNKKYKEYFNVENKFKCRSGSGGGYEKVIMQLELSELFVAGGDTGTVQNGYEHYNLCEFKL